MRAEKIKILMQVILIHKPEITVGEFARIINNGGL
jgi:hypothetical protein